MKRGQLPWKWLLFSLLAVLLFGIALIPWLIGDTSRFGDRVAERLAVWTGGKVKFTGPVTVSFFPDISVRGPLQVSGSANLPLVKSMTVKEAKVSLDLLDLLRGAVSIDVLRLQKPRIKLRQEANAKPAPPSALAALLADAPVRVLHLRNGRVDFGLTPIKDLYLRLDAGEESGALSGSGSFAYKGETVQYEVETGSPSPVEKGKTMPVKFAVNASPVTAKVAGTMSLGDAYKLDGKLQAEMINLRDFLNWVEFDLPPGESLKKFSVAGTLHLGGGVLSVEDGTFNLDGNKAAGVVALSAAPRPRVDGTFAFERLSLNPYLGKRSAGGALFEGALLGYFDADLRISGGEIVVGPFDLGRGGFTISAKRGSVTAEVGEVELCGGLAEGRINVELAPRAKQVSVVAGLTDIAMEPCLKPFGLTAEFTGIGALKAELNSKGNTLPQITRNLRGTFSLKAQDGRLPLDLAQLSSSPMPLEASGWNRSGGSSYERLKADCRFGGGQIWCRSLDIETPRETVAGTGDVDLPKQTLNLNLTVAKLGGAADASAQSGVAPQLSIKGSLQQPLIRRTERSAAGAESPPIETGEKQVAPH